MLHISFQCSSASRKFLNCVSRFGLRTHFESFSALQRAENSSTGRARAACCGDAPFQCSSASRKFLNRIVALTSYRVDAVSVLFSEPKIPQRDGQNAVVATVHTVSVLFSEPKIPQRRCAARRTAPTRTFQCSSASRKFLNSASRLRSASIRSPVSVLFSEPKIPQPQFFEMFYTSIVMFQCSSASRKFLNCTPARPPLPLRSVSVLFSEPKIPQRKCPGTTLTQCTVSVLFSEPKIPQPMIVNAELSSSGRFSALQRAENSSTIRNASGSVRTAKVSVLFSEPKIPQPVADARRGDRPASFQCSSASRKFLNRPPEPRAPRAPSQVSVLFSEPKIPQLPICVLSETTRFQVSVLFSEPKIPQRYRWYASLTLYYRFQCSSASRKFLNQRGAFGALEQVAVFQCSSASRKFLNFACWLSLHATSKVSVLFSEPKIPQLWRTSAEVQRSPFQCSSASRKFLNLAFAKRTWKGIMFQCSSASRKFLNWKTIIPSEVL